MACHADCGILILTTNSLRMVVVHCGWCDWYPTQRGTYPTQRGTYPTQQGTYPTQQGMYPTQQGMYPTQQGMYPTQQGTYPTQQGMLCVLDVLAFCLMMMSHICHDPDLWSTTQGVFLELSCISACGMWHPLIILINIWYVWKSITKSTRWSRGN